MSMMIHRNKKKKLEKKSALVQSAENTQTYKEEIPEEQRYTKTDISRMNKDDLVSLANELGIENVEKMSGNDLKKELIQKFEL